MKVRNNIIILVLCLASLAILGCASYSQTFVGKGGDIQRCASNSQDQGIVGVALASNRFNKCAKDMKLNGYVEIGNVGSVGILFFNPDEYGLRIRKVYENSPAVRAGIMRGDVLVDVDGNEVSHSGDAEALIGTIGTPVEVVISRNGGELRYRLVLAAFHYSNALGDIAF